VFSAKRGDRIKVLLWGGSGLVLGYKRQVQGKFAWPKLHDGIKLREFPFSGLS
jgi:transposase